MGKEAGIRGIFIVVFALISVIFSTIMVSSSEGDCPESQIMMRLSDTSNAHGALWNNLDYEETVCYSDLFNVEYNLPNPHLCDTGHEPYPAEGLNGILRLSDSGNAHAQIIRSSSLNYNFPVCYGDLNCTVVDWEAGCNESQNYTEVVALSSYTDAHLEKGGGGNYKYEICCKSNFAGNPCPDGNCNEESCPLGSVCKVWWAETADSEDELDSATITNKVYMIARSNLTQGLINFSVYRRSSTGADTLILSKMDNAPTNGIYYSDWDIPGSVLISATNEFYINATAIVGSSITAYNLSNNLKVDKDGCNDAGTIYFDEAIIPGGNISTTNPSFQCFNTERDSSMGGVCCPNGWYCEGDEDNSFCKRDVSESCIIDKYVDNDGIQQPIVQCLHYTYLPPSIRIDACEADCKNVSKNINSYNGLIGNCFWNGTKKECQFNETEEDGGGTISGCVWTPISQGACENGQRRTEYLDCNNENHVTYPSCVVLELPFFGSINLMITLLVIAIVYFIATKNRGDAR